MRTSILSLAAAFALGAAAVTLGSGTIVLTGERAMAQTAAPSPAPGASTTAPTVPEAAAAVVHIKNFAYDPATVTIHPGQTVRFVEDDDTAHTVTATDHSYDSGNLDKGQSWSHTFTPEGTYKYFCAYHPYMTASITVK